jgi:hypothetical protein
MSLVLAESFAPPARLFYPYVRVGVAAPYTPTPHGYSLAPDGQTIWL